MIDGLVTGKLTKDPMRKVGQSGKPFCNFVLLVNQHNEETTVLVSGICFGDVAEKVSRLKKGDPLTVVGQAGQSLQPLPRFASSQEDLCPDYFK
jgi:single-stranded DNA-binding protein